MTVWTPEYKVIIDGQEVTNITLVGFNITSGRTIFNSQAQAGYASVRLLNTTGAVYDWSINSAVTIEVKNSSGSFIPIFGGRISDIGVGVEKAGSEAIVTTIDFYALGALSKIQNSLWTGSLTEDLDGAQIFEILQDLLVNQWNEVSPAQTWSNYSTTETWENAQNIGLGEIDPGNFTMISRDASPINTYSIVSDIASSGLGYLYEDANGLISYGDAARRTTYLTNNGFLKLSGDHAMADGVRAITRQGDLCNELVISYGDNSSSSFTYEDDDSKALYGLFARNITSRVKEDADAEEIAERFVKLRAYPNPKFDSITFALQNPEISDADRDALISVFMGLPILIDKLPNNINGGSFAGYVEGWILRSSISGLSITLTVSPKEFSSFVISWDQAGNNLIWDDVNAIIDWENAIGALN